MKLEGEANLFHSNTGLDPESECFEFNDDDLDSAGYKQQNQKVKLHENIDLKKIEQDSDLSPHNMESVDCKTTPKLSTDMIGLKSDYEAQVRDFVDFDSNDLESFMKLPNDIESVKRSATSPVSKSPDKIDSFVKSVDVYMVKSVTECKPEMVVCYKDSSYEVKDICVDEGVPKMDNFLFENIVDVDEKAFDVIFPESFDNKELKKGSIEIDALNTSATEESDQVSDNHDQLKDLMHKDDQVSDIHDLLKDSVHKDDQVSDNHDQLKDSMQNDDDLTEKLDGNVDREIVMPGENVSSQELDTQQSDTEDSGLSDNKTEQVPGEPQPQSQSEDSKTTAEEAVSVSHTAAPVVDESSGDSILLENGTFSYCFGPSAPAACGKEECHQVRSCKCNETQTSWPLDGVTDGKIVTSQDRHILGESSFSAAGPVSGRISYSGPVPYSGSISLRSDSSTTSTRSFAFPILQSEWNSSPVRMAKADKSNYRKHCGWKRRLLCCRF